MLTLQTLEAEHAELRPQVEELRRLADDVGVVTARQLGERLDQVHAFLVEHLLPHATMEDADLYPRIADILGDTRATATMSRDHTEIAHLVDELTAARQLFREGFLDWRTLRRVLYGLYHVISLHFAKEEELYLPLLEAQHPGGASWSPSSSG